MSFLMLGVGRDPTDTVATNITDSFNRTDSATTLGSTDTGQAWIAHLGTWGISSNRAYVATLAAVNVATVASSLANGIAGVTFTTIPPGGANPRLVTRFTDVDNYIYLEADPFSTYKLYKRVAGSDTEITLTGDAVSVANGDVVTMEMDGSDYTIIVNAEDPLTATDAAHSSATRHGLGVNGDGSDVNCFDNFSVTAL